MMEWPYTTCYRCAEQCAELIDDCRQMADVQLSLNNASIRPVYPRRLIISSGDTSDVDGFLALAEYSKVRFALGRRN